MYFLKHVSQDMTKGQITPKLIEDIVSVAAFKGAVLLITKNHRNQAHACTIKKAGTCTPYSSSGYCWTLKTAALRKKEKLRKQQKAPRIN